MPVLRALCGSRYGCVCGSEIMQYSLLRPPPCCKKRSVCLFLINVVGEAVLFACQASIEKSEASTPKEFFFRFLGFWEMLGRASQRIVFPPPTYYALSYAKVGVLVTFNAVWDFSRFFHMVGDCFLVNTPFFKFPFKFLWNPVGVLYLDTHR